MAEQVTIAITGDTSAGDFTIKRYDGPVPTIYTIATGVTLSQLNTGQTYNIADSTWMIEVDDQGNVNDSHQLA